MLTGSILASHAIIFPVWEGVRDEPKQCLRRGSGLCVASHADVFMLVTRSSPLFSTNTCLKQPRSQGPLSTSRKYPAYGWSRVC